MRTRTERSSPGRTGGRALLVAALAMPVAGQVTMRVSVATSGSQGSGESNYASISADGRYVAFVSWAEDLVAGDTNAMGDIFVRDRVAGTTTRVSVDPAGGNSWGDCLGPAISSDGRYVAFFSPAMDLVSGDANGFWDVFVRDLQLGTTELASLDSGGAQGNSRSDYPSISADGRYVAFGSLASNFVAGDSNGTYDVFVRDRQSGTTEPVSVDSVGILGNGYSEWPSISSDGRYVTFSSYSTNLVPGDTNGWADAFLRDRLTGTTERVSVGSGGIEGNLESLAFGMSADGRFVGFSSQATNLVSGDTNGSFDGFVRDRQSGTTERVTLGSGGTQGNNSSHLIWISPDGRYVGFESEANNFVSGDTNGDWDAFIRDRLTGTTELVSLAPGGMPGNGRSSDPRGTPDGRYVVFSSFATDLVPGDLNGTADVFVRDRLGGTAFASLCDPGAAGVISCPCANAPGGPGRGCNNSAATGGAILGASGGTYLSSDSLVFTTSGERPTPLSIVSQWSGTSGSGVVFGMGVRCTSGTLKRLYTKSAVAGSITAPDFGAGELSVSAQSAAKGDVIQPGQSRWYLVYYRDPNVLGGCPSSSTFNATQTGVVSWWP